MKSVNRVELKGVIGQDARINTAGNSRVANFSLATEFLWVDKDGNKMKDTDWHNIVAWEVFGIADFSKLVKGARVSVVGRLRTRNYADKQGNQRYVTEVVADELDVIDDLPRQAKAQPQQATAQKPARNNDDEF